MLRVYSARLHLNWFRPSSDVANHRRSASTFGPLCSFHNTCTYRTVFFISVSPSTSIVSFRYVNSSILQAQFFLLVTSASATSSLYHSSWVFVRQQNNYASLSLPVICNIRIQCKLYWQYRWTFTYMHYNAHIQLQIQTRTLHQAQWRMFAYSSANLTNCQAEYYHTELWVCWRYRPASSGKAILKYDEQILSNSGGGQNPKIRSRPKIFRGLWEVSTPLKFCGRTELKIAERSWKLLKFFFEIIAPPKPNLSS